MKPAPKSILLISAVDEPFVDDDAEILASRFRVERRTGQGPGALAAVLTAVPSCDLVFSWFLSVYGATGILAGKLLGKRSVAIVGGVDAAAEPEYGYGLWLDPVKSAAARAALAAADRVLAVDESIKIDLARHAGGGGGGGENVSILPTGYDPSFWTPSGEKLDVVLSVASAHDRPRAMVKGLDRLLKIAGSMPEIQFMLVGTGAEALSACGLSSVPANLEVVGRVSRTELREHYRRARVYLQTSRREGLPNSLCEAMLCECIPVATGAGGTAGAVGGTGIVVSGPDGIVPSLKRVLSGSSGSGAAARLRIAAKFPLEKRRESLIRIVEELI